MAARQSGTCAPAPDTPAARKRRGDYPTPAWLVDSIVDATIERLPPGGVVTVLDPACGDGRFLAAARRRAAELGGSADVVGMDIDARAVATATTTIGAGATIMRGDALAADWGDRTFDVVVGNPPFLSQLAAATTRGRASRHGGGPYADAAVEFLALATRLARADGGRIGFVLPQSVLASRDAAAAREALDATAAARWSWWSPRPVFDAEVLTCALVLELGAPEPGGIDWSAVVTCRLGVPPLAALGTDGTLGDRAALTANFRDQYYGLVPAVVEGGTGPPLVTSGLVDPGRCTWGERAVTFARRRFLRPTVDLDRLTPAMATWAAGLLVPKVLVANQTRVVEAVADVDGAWLPGVPVVTARPRPGAAVDEVGAVLTSPVASAWAWHRAGGTGLSANSVRLGPRWLAELPWPSGPLGAAVAALADGDVVGCGDAVSAAYGVDPAGPAGRALGAWWARSLPPRPRPGHPSHLADGAAPGSAATLRPHGSSTSRPAGDGGDGGDGGAGRSGVRR